MNVKNIDDDDSIEIEVHESAETYFRKLRDDNPRPCDVFDMAAHWGALENNVLQSEAGVLARKGGYLIDKWHNTSDMTMGEWESVVRNLNARTEDGQKFADLIDEIEERVYDKMVTIVESACELGSSEMENTEKVDDYVDYMVRWKFFFTTYYGGQVEQLVADHILGTFDDVNRVLITQSEIRAATGIENPEAAGIDLYLPETDTTVQVKAGQGGVRMRESCDADLVARYVVEEKNRHAWPYVSVARTQ